MNNGTIILMESIRLMEAGKLTGSGFKATITDRDGNEKVIELPEEIHTFAAWKSSGYIVKRGEHAIASFPIWVYRENRRNNSDGQQETDNENSDGNQSNSGRMYLKKSFFFKRSQVEKITA